MSEELVLITGATGHLGFKILVTALEAGYRTRIALRRLEQAEKIKTTKSIQHYLGAIEFVQVPDITASNAYDEAIKGVTAVLHIASPIYSGFGPEEVSTQRDWQRLLYDPAEKGTVSMLSAAATEPSVKKVVVTSSVVVLEPRNGSTVAGPYDLKALPDVETRKSFAVAAVAYATSKVLAYVSATDYVEKNKVKFGLVHVLPGYIQGANELYQNAEAMEVEATAGSNEGTMKTALGITVGRPRVTAQVFLNDVAKAHVLALKSEVAKHGDNLLVVGNGGKSTPWSEYVPVIKKHFPEAAEKGRLNPKALDESALRNFDVSSSEKALGFTFGGTEEIVTSVVGQYVELKGAA